MNTKISMIFVISETSKKIKSNKKNFDILLAESPQHRSLSHQSLENLPKILRYFILHSLAWSKDQTLINFLPILIQIFILTVFIFILIFSFEDVLIHSYLSLHKFIFIFFWVVFLLRVLTIFTTQSHQSLRIEHLGNISQFLHVSLVFLFHGFHIILIAIF